MTESENELDAKVAENLADVRRRLSRALEEAGRPAGSCALVAVSKSQPEARIDAAVKAGHRIFGENRVQEAQVHWQERRPAIDGLRLHLIGGLQSNKLRPAFALFDVIETLDREKLARAMAKEADGVGHCPDIFIQVNTGEEPQKGGVLPGALEALVSLARDQLGLPIRGLMCIPPQGAPAAPHFAFLAGLARRFGLGEVSMGMTADFEEAVRQGATLVRVGTAIFGERGQRRSDPPAAGG